MQALTYYQPHATLHALGAKTVETRPRDTKHRGWLAIHAARNTPDDWRELTLVDPFRRVLEALIPGYAGWDSLTHGAIVGVYWLASVTSTESAVERWNVRQSLSLPDTQADYDDVPLYELAFGNYEKGRKSYWTTMIHALPEPIPCPGMSGMWDTKLLHEEFYRDHSRFDVDPTELAIRQQMMSVHGVDISKHAMDEPAWHRLSNRRGALGLAPERAG